MNLLMTSLALLLPLADTPKQAAHPESSIQANQNLDGDWTVLYAEMEGQKLDGKGFTHVRIKDNVVTCNHGGQEKSWRLEFGPHHRVRCTELSDNTGTVATENRKRGDQATHSHHGVYIASPEYFCLSMNKGRDDQTFTSAERREGDAAPNQAGTEATRSGRAQRAQFVLILHRTGTAPAAGGR